MKTKKQFYFIGINGIGMSGLAEILANKGHEVSGSDKSESLDIKKFTKIGINAHNNHSKENITSNMTVIYSSAIPDDNEELKAAKNLGCKCIRRGEFLAELSREFKTRLAIAGTHGKTTTSSLTAHIFDTAKLSPSYFIGGHLVDKPHAQIRSNDLFITELDESDGTFLDFKMADTIITNIELDHIDYYKTKDQLIKKFKQYIDETVKSDYKCIINLDDPISEKIYKKFSNPSKFLTYSIESDMANVIAKNIEYNWQGISFELIINNQLLDRVSIGLFGKHNVYNALAAISMAITKEISLKDIISGLNSFKGVKRRLELKYKLKNVLLYDDYAHHPSEIITTLEGVYKSFSDYEITTIFQPHRFTRLTSLFDGFSSSFKRSNNTIILPVFSAGEEQGDNKTSIDLVNELNKKGLKSLHCDTFESAKEKITEIIQEKSIIILMGAGNITKISKDLIPVIKEKVHY